MMTTTNEKAPSARNTGGSGNQTNVGDFATLGYLPKEVFTLIAQCALGGYSVNQLPGAGYVVSKHGHTYRAKNFADLQAFVEEMGV
jgi:hypothetical protein